MKHAKENPVAKRLVTVVTVIAAVIALTAGGTLAYFSTSERAHNVITSGGVDIELLEWADESKQEQWNSETSATIMPGTSVTKIVEVKNIGGNDAWVRVKVDKAFSVENEARDASVLVCDLPGEDSSHWVKKADDAGVEWWYYVRPLAPGSVTEVPLFKSVTLVSDTGNAYQGGEATVTVSVQAVQYENNGDKSDETVFDAVGWPDAEI